MKWNAFDLISPSINRTKKRIFPFNLAQWIRLAFIAILAGGSSSGGNYGSYSGQNNDFSGKENVSGNIRNFLKTNGLLIGILTGVLVLVCSIIGYIKSVFSFIFIESVLGKEAKFNFRKNSSKGLSFFLFKFAFCLISLLLLLALAYPYISAFMNGYSLLSVGAAYISFSIVAAFFIIFAVIIFNLFLIDFVVPLMYAKNVPASYAFTSVWAIIRKNKKETFVYWLARLVMNLAVGIMGLLMIIALLIAFAIVGLVIFLLGLLLYVLLGKAMIVLGIIFLVLYILLFIFVVIVLVMPFEVYLRYFSLSNFEKLMGIKLLKN